MDGLNYWIHAIWVLAPAVLCALVIPSGLALFLLIDNKTADGRPSAPLWILVLMLVPFSTVFLMYLGLIVIVASTWNFGP